MARSRIGRHGSSCGGAIGSGPMPCTLLMQSNVKAVGKEVTYIASSTSCPGPLRSCVWVVRAPSADAFGRAKPLPSGRSRRARGCTCRTFCSAAVTTARSMSYPAPHVAPPPERCALPPRQERGGRPVDGEQRADHRQGGQHGDHVGFGNRDEKRSSGTLARTLATECARRGEHAARAQGHG